MLESVLGRLLALRDEFLDTESVVAVSWVVAATGCWLPMLLVEGATADASTAAAGL